MTNFDSTLLFPVRDAYARKQFLLASLLMLANMIIPLIPMLILMGYVARIMRQIIEAGKEPSMLEWQGSDWGELLREGFRIFAVRLVFGLPSMLLMACGFILMLSSPFLLSSQSNGDSNPLAPLGGISLFVGIGILLFAIILSIPLGMITGAAESHAVAQQSFQAGLQVREWWPIFRAGLSGFIGAYLFAIAAGFILGLLMQIAMITIVLICIVPFLSLGYSAYLLLVMNALFAQAYTTGQKEIQAVTDARA